MFDLCFIGENVVEEDAVVEYRMTKAVKKFIEKGADTFYVLRRCLFYADSFKGLPSRKKGK